MTVLDLQPMELMGTVPSQFGSLKSLQSLVLSKTNLNGSIPKEIGDYSGLVMLDLSGNRLTGTIPLEIGKLKNLQTLKLQSNSRALVCNTLSRVHDALNPRFFKFRSQRIYKSKGFINLDE